MTCYADGSGMWIDVYDETKSGLDRKHLLVLAI